MYRYLIMYLHYLRHCCIPCRDKNRRTRELHQSGTFERDPILRYVHNEFQNVMIRTICICVLSLKIPRC